MKKLFLISLLFIGVYFFPFLTESFGDSSSKQGQNHPDVVISEFMASSSDRLLNWTAGPGTSWTIEAESYLDGGEGVAYHDTTSGNQNGEFRADDVDIAVNDEGGFKITNLEDGEWLKYDLSIENSSFYNIWIRVSKPVEVESGGSIRFELDGTRIRSPLSIPYTGRDTTWVYLMIPRVPLIVGEYTLTLFIEGRGFSVDGFRFSPALESTLGYGVQWKDPEFDDSDWETGTAKFGTGETAATNIETQMIGITPSLYLRKQFDVSIFDASSLLELGVDFEGGFITYLNGQEVLRKNLGPAGLHIFHDQVAFNQLQSVTPEFFSLGLASELLVEGTNTIAAQVHSFSIIGATLAFDGRLRILHNAEISEVLSPGEDWKYLVGINEPPGILLDEDGDSSDWIEIHNSGDSLVSLNEWVLTDHPDSLEKWIFPDIFLNSDEYLLVFASGKNRSATDFHTNFKLSSDGEYLALLDNSSPRNIISSVSPEFPMQFPNVSYGLNSSTYAYFKAPTPGNPNSAFSFLEIASPPVLSHLSGLYDASFSLEMVSGATDESILFTLDGSEPTLTNSLFYSEPIQIDISRVVKARGFKDNFIPSEVVVRTFLLNQEDYKKELPVLSIVSDKQVNLNEPYGIMSIVWGGYIYNATRGDEWKPLSFDDYSLPTLRGRGMERPVSLDWFGETVENPFQIFSGLRISGSDFTRRHYQSGANWKFEVEQKFSFRTYFRNEYGQDNLLNTLIPDSPVENFKSLVIRGGHNDFTSPFIRDEMVRRLYADMGWYSSLGIFSNLYINGEYKGFFNIVEQLDQTFFQNHNGGGKEWDIIKPQEVVEGESTIFNGILDFISNFDLGDYEQYVFLSHYLDYDNFIDYLLLNIYVGSGDWPLNNWVAARERSDEGKFEFYPWDSEICFGSWEGKPLAYNTIEEDLLKESPPLYYFLNIPTLFQHLYKSPDFKLLFADRIQKYFFGDGALTDENILNQFLELKNIMIGTIEGVYGESFRDYGIEDTWIPQRRDIIFQHFKDAGLWPDLLAPEFVKSVSPDSGKTVLTITNPNDSGYILYTLDEIDPRLPNSGFPYHNSKEYREPVSVTSTIVVKARILDPTNEIWSPIIERVFDSNSLEIIKAKLANRNLLLLDFNQPLDATSYLDLNNFVIDNDLIHPSGIKKVSLDSLLLEFPTPFVEKIDYQITTTNIANSSGEIMISPSSAYFSFLTPPISISEIMYNNNGSDIEWVELLNTSEDVIDVSGWYLTDDELYPAQGEGFLTLPPDTLIQPGEFVVLNLWNHSDFSLWNLPITVRIINTVVGDPGSLSNSGDNLALFDSGISGNLVDGSLQVPYPDLSTNGESIEKIDEYFPWGDGDTIQYNFRKCPVFLGFETGLNENLEELSLFGTPGRQNGVFLETKNTIWMLY